MRKKLMCLGFALAAVAAASNLPSVFADTPVNSFCPQGTRRIDCTQPPPQFICCPNNALCFC
jgi:hypothetical protein